MQFNSYSYLLLLIPAVSVFWMLPVVWRKPFVLCVSVLFYASWNPLFVLVPVILCAGVYLCSRRILASPQNSRPWFWIGVAFVVAIFFLFRYRQFLIDNINGLLTYLRVHPISASLSLAVPLGISFYSFEAISYLIDFRQGRVHNGRFSDLFLFVIFWPHLIAGPIVRFRELAPQFVFTRRFEVSMLVKGLDRLILGLVQKNLIANSLGAWVDEGFLPRVAAGNSTIDNWFLAIAFGLQIYYDFASYSNMAIGAAQLIGVTLPENFRFPYHARNPADFWSRWHMTLSRWIRDYLFFPVNARFKGAPGPLYVSLLGIMALVGLWHGAGWNFVLWGVLHGIYLALYRIWEAVQEGRFKGLGQSPVVLSAWRVFTLVAVMAAWVPFRAASGGQAATMLRSMFFDFRFATSFSANFYLVTLLIAAYSVIEPFLASAIERGEKWLLERHALWIAHLYILRPAIYAVGILMFMIFDDRDTQFIYFQF